MLLLIDKPQGFTSFDLIKKLKRLYPGEKIGHAGTLDPLATGLLLVAIGSTTKQLRHFVGLDKTYVATIDFSQTTDTWDSDYRKEHTTYPLDDHHLLIEGRKVPFPTYDQVEQLLQTMVGTHLFPLTPFSAKKWKGKKLYEYARNGEPVLIDMPMEILRSSLKEYQFPFLTVEREVGSGTYIRSLAHWLGKQLGTGGIIVALRRTQVGEFHLQ